MPHDEAELLARWRAGDDAAGTEVCARHHALVARLVAAHRPRSWSADDLVQEVFLTMFARCESYCEREGVPFAHWLSRLAINVARDRLKAEVRRGDALPNSPECERALEWLCGHSDAAAHDAEVAREAVEVLLAALCPTDRLVLTLLDIEGRSAAEVAQLTGWTRGAVRVRAFRARLRLRAVAMRRERRPR
jgi:RNA polymerase sigma-70 factor (ECF subfamily)